MIQTHSFDGWTDIRDRASFAYRITRELGAAVAPSFLFLAGVGLAFAEGSARSSRFTIARRGLFVFASGYFVSIVYALIEWDFRPTVLFRFDILQCIGLSILVVAMLLYRKACGRAVALFLVVSCVVVAPLLRAFGVEFSNPMFSAFFDVPGYTRFPLFPLLGFCLSGFFIFRDAPPMPRITHAFALLLALLVAAAVSRFITTSLVEASGLPLSRAHPAVAANFVDGLARVLAALMLAALLQRSGMLAERLVILGRHSLVVYAVHIPFCYGRLSAWASRSLTFPVAAGFTLLLVTSMVVLSEVLDRPTRRKSPGAP